MADGNAKLVHDVYFALHDAAPAARDKLIAACNRYLRGHEGVLAFACGIRAAALQRDVNDLEFDVGMQIIFRDRATHDAYQVSPLHNQFIEENRANWKRVRVFDYFLSPSP